MIDTGSSCNLIKLKLAEQLGLDIEPRSVQASSYTGHNIEFAGQTQVVVEVGNMVFQQNFMVTKGKCIRDILIGFRGLWSFGNVTFHIRQGVMSFDDQIVNLIPSAGISPFPIAAVDEPPEEEQAENPTTVEENLPDEQEDNSDDHPLEKRDDPAEFVFELPPKTHSNPIDHIDVDWDSFAEEDRTKVRAFFDEFQDCFAGSMDDLGRTTLMDPVIETVPHEPFQCRAYNVPPKYIEKVYQLALQMFAAGLVRVSSSPYLNPSHYVQKKDGSLRLTLDLRRLNKLVRPTATVLPSLSSFTHHIKGNCMFSSLDLKQGFFQIPFNDEGSIEKLAFSWGTNIHLPNAELCVVPMGLKSSPNFMQMLSNLIVAGLDPAHFINYLDDFAILSEDLDSHLVRLRQLFTNIRKAGLNHSSWNPRNRDSSNRPSSFWAIHYLKTE